LVTNDILLSPSWRLRRAPSNEERRRRLVTDGVAWILVALIHLLIFLTLVISLEQARLRSGVRTPIESILDLSLLRRNNTRPMNLTQPEQNEEEPDISAKPLTVIPPKVPIIPPPETAQPARPGDVLNSVGQYLSCGAGNFENLTPAQQLRCRRQPWRAVQLPNGALVLDAQPRLADPGPQLHITGAEALGHQMQTNSGCPLMINMPCLQDMFTGNNSAAPGIPDPH
jgi:hypothetical protein